MNPDSTALEITSGGLAPQTADENTAFHAELLEYLISGARDAGWQGAEFARYDRHDGRVAITLRPGNGWPDLAALRDWREAHRNDPPLREEQERLL